MSHHLRGVVFSKQERWADAEKQFRKALLSNPTQSASNQGLSEALRRQGQAAEAVRFARRAVHWGEPQNPEVLLTLGEAYAAANRRAESRETLERARFTAERTNPALAQVIFERLRELP